MGGTGSWVSELRRRDVTGDSTACQGSFVLELSLLSLQFNSLAHYSYPNCLFAWLCKVGTTLLWDGECV